MNAFISSVTSVIFVIVFFGGSIFIHELGHFIVAKMCGMFVPKFSIGFGPKLFGFTYKGTEFIVSLLPFGGYVAVPQLADLEEIEGKYDIPCDAKKATCFDKVVVAAAGPFANVIFAIALSVLLHFVGLPTMKGSLDTSIGYVPRTIELEDGTEMESPAVAAGLMADDKVLSVDGTSVKKFDDISQLIVLGTRKDSNGRPVSTLKVQRNGKILTMDIFPAMVTTPDSGSDKFREIGILPKQTLVIDKLSKFFDSDSCDLQTGDLILSANGVNVYSIDGLHDELDRSDGSVELMILRDGERLKRTAKVHTIDLLRQYVDITFGKNGSKLCIFDAGWLTKVLNEYTCIFSDKKFLKENGIPDEPVQCMFKKNHGSLEDIAEHARADHKVDMDIKIGSRMKSITLTGISSAKFEPKVSKNFIGISFVKDLVKAYPTPTDIIGDVFSSTVKSVNGLFCHDSDVEVKHMMGPVGLVRTLYTFAETSISWLIWFVVLININLAMINLLPLPILDGGIIAMSIISKITGWRCLDKIFAKLQTLFFYLLLAFMVYVSFFDVKRMMRRRDDVFRAQLYDMIYIRHND